ncbi:uncharacterized protein LOC129766561 [Toxorhynchites rutilus septentrionalis]|uniref:uncharacterized protein LOC129766561 n=1 Tax=Toxorhynchites rutilus septentrionalis TaxID=329112 RepID=UPI0024789413|nr:uncharacterized protein LOC129766561 [Toxorhynchites rutilus septentrionalis]
MKNCIILALQVICITHLSFGANILVLSGVPSPSHSIWLRPLTKALAAKGHNVTVISPDVEKLRLPNYTYIHLENLYSSIYNTSFRDTLNFFEMAERGTLHIVNLIDEFGIRCCEISVESKGFKQLLDYPKDFKFDLFMSDIMNGPCLASLLLHRFGNPPYIPMTPYNAPSTTAPLIGSYVYPAAIPNHSFDAPLKMTLWERTKNFIFEMYDEIVKDYYLYPEADAIIRRIFPGAPSAKTLQNTIKLLFINTNPLIQYKEPMLPNVIPVGGMQIRKGKALPDDLSKIVNKAAKGFVLFSLGTNARSDLLGPERVRSILTAMRNLPEYTFLWKFESDESKLPMPIPKNVYIRAWMPQNDLLAHPNIMLFITHSGLLSTQETIWNGVPVIGVPLFADQFRNINYCTSIGVGKRLSIQTLTAEELSETIKEVITNPDYSNKMKRLSQLVRDQPESPLERAVWWTEWVLRNPDVDMLEFNAANFHWFKKYGYDVMTLLLSVVLMLVYVVFRISKYLIYHSSGIVFKHKKEYTIKFTVEKESDGKHPFLDLIITRKEDNILKFGIYRKPTSTDRYITSDSYHFEAQKKAAFHSMSHRLFNIPMEKAEFEAERKKIHEAAFLNSYNEGFINKILRKHERMKHHQNATILQSQKEDIQRIGLPFYPKVTNAIRGILNKHGFHIAYKSAHMLKNLLCSPEDKIPSDEKSGIYEIMCKSCPAVFSNSVGVCTESLRPAKVRIMQYLTFSLRCIIWLLLTEVTRPIRSANILILMSVPSPSHYIWMKPIANKLATRGHNVTIISANVDHSAPVNVTYIHLENIYRLLHGNGENRNNIVKRSEENPFEATLSFYKFATVGCIGTVSSNGFKTLMNYPNNFHFDTIIYDFTCGPCILGFLHKFNYAPLVSVSAFGIPQFTHDLVEEHRLTTNVPHFSLMFPPNMGFGERVFNYLVQSFDSIYRKWVFQPRIQKIANEAFNTNLPSLAQLETHSQIVLVNSNPIFEQVETLPQNVIPVGGLQIVEPQKLSQNNPEIEEFINASAKGTVLFAMGTNFKSEMFTRQHQIMFIEAFAQFTGYNFIWKFDGTTLPIHESSNLMIRPWLPQNDILAHPRVKAFITHCGLLSIYEATYHGVPTIGIPVYVDQHRNARKTVRAGVGVTLDLKTLSTEAIQKALVDVLENSQIERNMQRMSVMLRDQPEKPLDRAIWWIEWVVRHPHTKHLRSPMFETGIAAQNGIDVILFLVFIAFVAVCLTHNVHKRLKMKLNSKKQECNKKQN